MSDSQVTGPRRFPVWVRDHGWVGGFVLVAAFVPAPLLAAPGGQESIPTLVIPRVSRPPALEDFLGMQPSPEISGQLTKIDRFIQREPSDGEPATQRTEAYAGYDDTNLYVVFVCFDSEPDKIRARMTPRENTSGDEWVHVVLDTFTDQRRAYILSSTPHGIQWDALWTEGGNEGPDVSFDALYHSRGALTPQGYIVWMAIPFKSLRFPSTTDQTWGILFGRNIPRLNEQVFWPAYSSRIEGRLNQAGRLRGLERISPGRNVQLIPFGMFRSFRALDTRDPLLPQFVRDRADSNAGLDAKFVFKDSLVMDVALNPDFSQVESDEPQVTVNRRFEVFFPEKRPFFLENANFFRTPINLVFTRRIADPQLGIRLTGKTGPYAIGGLLANDASPGQRLAPSDPLAGRDALFGLVRVSRDLFEQSSIGVIYTDRRLDNAVNRVGGIDGRFKLSKNWVTRFQGVASSTTFTDGTRRAGPAYVGELNRAGRQFVYNLQYSDFSPGFHTEPGFVIRSDVRAARQFVQYRFRPEGKRLISWGPQLFAERIWDHTGLRLDTVLAPGITWDFRRQTSVSVFAADGRVRLRPADLPVLSSNRDFRLSTQRILFRTSYFPELTVTGFMTFGTDVNFVPPVGVLPTLAEATTVNASVTLQPGTKLKVDNAYVLSRLTDRETGARMFDNHIVRTKWNWQFSQELSVRAILQYSATLANSALTALETTKNMNADLLVTYRVNPWTVLFVGFNSNGQNIDLVPTATGADLVRRRRQFINDSSQLFVKYSHLFRF